MADKKPKPSKVIRKTEPKVGKGRTQDKPVKHQKVKTSWTWRWLKGGD